MSKREAQARTAQSSAAKFARAQPGSTPMGFVRRQSREGETAEEESWPGPFAVAYDMISKREEARKAREEKLKLLESGQCEAADEEVELDRYDTILSTHRWTPPNNNNSNKNNRSSSTDNSNKRNVLSLYQLCLQQLASNFGAYSDVDFDEILQTDDAVNLSVELLRHNVPLTEDLLLRLTIPGGSCIAWPDCSQVPESGLLSILTKASGSPAAGPSSSSSSSSSSSPLTSMQLKHVGYSFTDRIAEFLCSNSSTHPPRVSQLQTLELAGCYRLSDEALSKLLNGCNGTLQHLSLPANSRVGSISLRQIGCLSSLCSLCLDDCTHLQDEDLRSLLGSESDSTTCSALPTLQHLHLRGLSEITDEIISALLRCRGRPLRSLALGRCTRLTDGTLVAIRQHCRKLELLDISHLINVSTAALLGLFVAESFNASPKADTTETTSVPAKRVPTESKGSKRQKLSQPPVSGDQQTETSVSASTTSSRNNSTSSWNDATFGEGVGRLRNVDLSGLVDLSDDVIQALAENCSAFVLEELRVHGCCRLTGRSTIILAEHCSTSLRSVDMSFARGIPESALSYLIQRCKATRSSAGVKSDPQRSEKNDWNKIFATNQIAVPMRRGQGGLDSLAVWGCTQLSPSFLNYVQSIGIEVVGAMTA